MPTAAAIYRVVVPRKPVDAKQRIASRRICLRRSVALRRRARPRVGGGLGCIEAIS
jgi:hypothetical protein